MISSDSRTCNRCEFTYADKRKAVKWLHYDDFIIQTLDLGLKSKFYDFSNDIYRAAVGILSD